MKRVHAGAIAAALAAAIALGVGACASPDPEPAASAPPTPAPTVAATPRVAVPVAPATPAPARHAVAPITVSVAAVDVEVPVVEVGVDGDDFMELPVDPAVAGWYRFGSDPTSAEGNTVISAHVDAPDYPIGPFSRLRDLSPGAEVAVQDAAGAIHRYAVQSVEYHRKAELPVGEIFRRSGTPSLVLITCGGPFDPAVGRYEDNVVVIASPME
jgi:hypothetical protein